MGILHAITGPFCGYYDVPHGVANAVLLPHVMRFNLPGNIEKYSKIAAALGVNTENMSIRQAAQKSIEAVQDLLIDEGRPVGDM